MIFNEDHKHLFTSLKDFYKKNIDEFINLQDKVVRKGNDQTPINYWMQMHNVDINLTLPIAFNLTHLHRKEMFQFNWQLNENKTLHFIKHGYVWRFNGLPKDQRTNIMKQTWDLVKHHYTDDPIEDILNHVKHKHEYKNATSRKFKKDLYEFFKTDNIESVVEFGCCQGDTTKVLSCLAKTVHASDISTDNVEVAKNKCMGDTNILFEVKDINSEWEYKPPDVIYLDALHDINGIQSGIDRVKKQYPNSIVVMDDYGHIMNTVKPIIDNLIQSKQIEVLKWIGEDKGYIAANQKHFINKEGIIFKFTN
jgi:hypothetical protein